MLDCDPIAQVTFKPNKRPRRAAVDVSQLTGEQRDVFNACMAGKNVFFTGCAVRRWPEVLARGGWCCNGRRQGVPPSHLLLGAVAAVVTLLLYNDLCVVQSSRPLLPACLPFGPDHTLPFGQGTGKSFLLSKIIQAVNPSTTFVTASTGISAVALNGAFLSCR